MVKKAVFAITGALALASLMQAASAAMTLTPAATGFTLTTFADGFPNGNSIGPVGLTVFGPNSVMVGDYNNGVIKIFTDTDGQHYGTATTGLLNYGAGVAGLTTLGGNIYLAHQGTGAIDQVNADGSLNHPLGTFVGATAIVGNSATNHLYLSNTAGGGIREIDLAGNTIAVFATGNGGADGLTVSPDNSTIYAEQGGHIYGYNTTTHAQVFDSGLIAGGADGVAIGSGTLAGLLFVNTNGGTIVEIDTLTNAQNLFATGGSRGDFVTVDPNNGTLLLTQTDSVLRLTAPRGGGFGGDVVPLPPAVWMGLSLVGCLGVYSFIQRRRQLADPAIA